MNSVTTKKSDRPTIALLVDSLIEDYEVRIWSSVCEVAKKHDVNLLCLACGTLDSPYLFSSQRGVLLDLVEAAVETGHIDGIISLSGSLANFSTPEKLRQTYTRFSKVPLVSVSAQFAGIPSITVNNAGGMHDMISHLIKHHGKRRIAFICGPEHSYDAQERLEAYKQVLKENGIPFDPQLIAPGDFMPPSGELAVTLFMDERKVKFDALVGANDYMALDAMKFLLARGIRIPQDVAVVGFDDAKEARSIAPSLSSVRQPKELGTRAVNLLLELLQGKKVPDQNLLPTQLIFRESCGCVITKTDDAGSSKKRAKASIELQEVLPKVAAECKQSFAVISEALENTQWLDELMQALQTDLASNTSAFRFLPLLKTLVAKGGERGLEILAWTELLYYIFNRLAPHISPEHPLPRLAFFVLNHLTEATEALRRAKYEEQTLLLCRVYQQMTTSLNVETLNEVAGGTMPRLQINSCYISTYADHKSGAQGYMRPVIAFEDGKNVIANNRAEFPAGQILPGGGLQQQGARFSFAVYALFVEQDQLGFAAYDMSQNINTSIYEILTAQLSSVLKSTALLDEVRNYARNLEAEVQQRTADLQKKTAEVERLNEELVRKNKIDGLTALYNRGAFFEFVQGEINRTQRSHQKMMAKRAMGDSFCIMMLDLDHFKRINDSYGHLMGDQVLKHIGDMLNNKNILRKEDIAGRFGGEEFIVVLTHATAQEALMPAQRLATALAKTDFQAEDGRTFKVTVSIGISQYFPSDPDKETVINRADKALYHAKETGRNKTYIYEEVFPFDKEE
jgi:diguanylate cyclase (GGDEF)-like protein